MSTGHLHRALARRLGWSNGLRHRERRLWLFWFALAVAVFGFWPEIDLAVTRLFYAGGEGAARFPLDSHPVVQFIYVVVPWLGRAALLLSVWWSWRWYRNRRPGSQRQGRRGLALLLVLVLGLGFTVHTVFKEQWGRPRPVSVQPFGGEHGFQPPLVPSAKCERNCSFVSGHAGTGFVLLAVGLLTAPASRRRWWRAGLVAGLAVGAVRIVQGGHFLSDVLFSGLVIWAVAQGVREAWLRWRVWRRQRRAALTA